MCGRREINAGLDYGEAKGTPQYWRNTGCRHFIRRFTRLPCTSLGNARAETRTEILHVGNSVGKSSESTIEILES